MSVMVAPALADVTFEWAEVGNPGNIPDALNEELIPGIGSVEYPYRISKHLVTNDQYAAFLNAVASSDTDGVGQLWIEAMGSDPRGGITRSGSLGSYTYAVKPNMGNKPVNLVSYLSAMRFVNWLHNGQPTGEQNDSTTEDGVYAIADGVSETRAADAKYFIPTENEWYKAAYHQPSADGGDDDDYWLYSTASNTPPAVATSNTTGDISNPGANVANYNKGADWNGLDGNLTTVGSAGTGSQSYYGTSDQSGNVLEWTETVAQAGESRVVRGGSWDNNEGLMQSSSPTSFGVIFGDQRVGFRIASARSFLINAAISDAWYYPPTSGQGFFIIVWEDIELVFLSWFTFDTERPPEDVTAILGEPGHRWLTALGSYSGDTATLDVFRTNGGVFDSEEPPAVTDPTPVGTITITWTGCNAGILSYNLPSLALTGDIPIERIVLSNVAACEAAQAE
jgi:sulfatase modifying factor 1